MELGSLPARARAKLFLNRTREDAAAASAADASGAPPQPASSFIPRQTHTKAREDYKSIARALAATLFTVTYIYLACPHLALHSAFRDPNLQHSAECHCSWNMMVITLSFFIAAHIKTTVTVKVT